MAGVVVVASAIAVVSRSAFTCAQSLAHRGWNPLWMPFNCAATGLLLLAGFSGYTSHMPDRFLANSAWTGSRDLVAGDRRRPRVSRRRLLLAIWRGAHAVSPYLARLMWRRRSIWR
jgi:hypothetical protein